MNKLVCFAMLFIFIVPLRIALNHQATNPLASKNFQVVQSSFGITGLEGIQVSFMENFIIFTGCYVNKAPYRVTNNNTLQVGNWELPRIQHYDDQYLLRSLFSKTDHFKFDTEGRLNLFDKTSTILLTLEEKEAYRKNTDNKQEHQVASFEYRMMKAEVAKEIFSQVDLYFFKPNMTGVGIKIRLEKKDCSFWESNDLELKIIENLNEINSGNTQLQQWAKQQIPINIEVFTKQHILSHPKKFKLNQGATIEEAIHQQLQRLNSIITTVIRNQLKKPNYVINQHLQNWLGEDQPLKEIYVVEKHRVKSTQVENGILRIYPLYNSNQQPTIWRTQEFEAQTKKELESKLQSFIKGKKENISYPKLVQKIHFGVIN